MSAQTGGETTLADFGVSPTEPDVTEQDNESESSDGTVEQQLGDYGTEMAEMTGAEWRRRFHACGEDYDRLAEKTGKPKREVFEALVEIGLVEPYADYYVSRLWPHELGLSPLNCANCGAREIREYECPECGHDPGEDGGEGDD